MKQTIFKGIEVFYNDCCTTEQQAIKYAAKENAKNYAQGNIDRIKGIYLDHSYDCKEEFING